MILIIVLFYQYTILEMGNSPSVYQARIQTIIAKNFAMELDSTIHLNDHLNKTGNVFCSLKQKKRAIKILKSLQYFYTLPKISDERKNILNSYVFYFEIITTIMILIIPLISATRSMQISIKGADIIIEYLCNDKDISNIFYTYLYKKNNWLLKI